MNKSLLTYSIVTFLIISFFGINFFFSLLGNILILLFLTPILLIGIAFLGINYFNSKLKICTNCGSKVISNSEICLYCGSNLNDGVKNKNVSDNASNETIEIEAEEIN